jgi:sulfane dehydrogenase subunit SoxC
MQNNKAALTDAAERQSQQPADRIQFAEDGCMKQGTGLALPISARDESAFAASRRQLLLRTAALGGAALAAAAPAARAAAEPQPLTVPAWSTTPGEPVLWHPYGQPAEQEKDVIRRSPPGAVVPGAGASFTPLQDLHGIITPSGLVFERHHSGIPKIDVDRHRLAIHGLVRQPLVLSMDDIVRFPAVSRIHFIECSGNTAREWRAPASKSVQFSHGLLSCCEWTGVKLSTVLDEAGVLPAARWLLAEGADAAGVDRSIPLSKAFEDALLVYAQNGEKLRPEQGYPLRLLVPGWEGNLSIKWLRRIKVGELPFHTRNETSKYTDLLPDGTARQFSFAMEAKSVITYPSADHKLRDKGFYEISGLAWTGQGRIKRVDVSVDGGRSWREARVDGPVLDRALTRFRFGWTWDGAPAILQSRAMDETGYVQPSLAQLVGQRGLNSGYHNNAIHSWSIAADGSISNVHV